MRMSIFLFKSKILIIGGTVFNLYQELHMAYDPKTGKKYQCAEIYRKNIPLKNSSFVIYLSNSKVSPMTRYFLNYLILN